MLKNYLKVALRNLRNHKGYSFVNVFGLAAGLACSFFIFLWVQDELSFNSFHADGRYFGPDWRTRDDILGTTFRIENRIDMTLTGVFEDIPVNSTLKFEFVLPVEEFNRRNEWVNTWTSNGLRLFVRLRKDADPVAVSAKIEGLIRENNNQWKTELFLQSITDMYLRSDFDEYGLRWKGSRRFDAV